jgi:hypothetical protein
LVEVDTVWKVYAMGVRDFTYQVSYFLVEAKTLRANPDNFMSVTAVNVAMKLAFSLEEAALSTSCGKD